VNVDSPQAAGDIDETLFEFAPDAILIVDPRGRIQKANPQAETIFGYGKDELVGVEIERLIPQRYRAAHTGQREGYSKAPRARRMGAQLELWAVRKDASEFAVEVALGPQRIGGENYVLCVVRDVTERQRAKEALQRAHDQLEHRVEERTRELSNANAMLTSYAAQLERSNRELQDFAYVASHDLQEPLRKIQAFGDRLRRQSATQLDEQSRDFLDRMINAAVRMQTLIGDLLAFSRVTTRAQPFAPVDLDRIAREVLEDLEVRVDESGGKVEVQKLPSVEADATQMRQLLQNLIGNALKFRAPDRAPHVQVKAEVVNDAATAQRFLELSVEDNGIGFEPKYTERIFGLFQRLHGRGEYEGSGVGLAICRKIVERHGGRITAAGRPGSGATFIIVIPEKHGGPL
jgi:two-component system sensor kinase FixL